MSEVAVSDTATEHLVVFTRWPEAGRAKTRLVAALGPDGAARLQERMTRHTLARAAGFARRRGAELIVRFAGGDAARMAAAYGRLHRYLPQGAGDLGQRLARAFEAAFAAGARRVVLVGTDCPELAAVHLRSAFDALVDSDVVLGPAEDGGYYLVGLARPCSSLFEDVPWGTAQVLGVTLRRATAAGRSVTRLVVLRDVDRPEDLPHAQATLARAVSVVIPTRNEDERLGPTLDLVAQEDDVEVLVVDGGSRDATREVAAGRGVHVLASTPGRAGQLNTGAQAAAGGVLLFCHADTHLPAGYVASVRRALAHPGVMLGAFDLTLRGRERGLRYIERCVRWRSRRLQLPYGDQALFMTRTAFERLGGFRQLPVMEDYDFVRRARRRGRIVMAGAAVSTSARFWRVHGMLRGAFLNQAVVLGWHLGVSPTRLAAWRRANRRG